MEEKREIKLIKSSHAVGESNFHIQLTLYLKQNFTERSSGQKVIFTEVSEL